MAQAKNRDETKLRKFAEALHTTGDAFKAGEAVYPRNAGLALKASEEWPSDPLVVETLARLKGEDKLPEKTELLRELWRKMNSYSMEEGADGFVKLARLYAEVAGLIEKPGNSQSVQVVLPRAMEVPVFASDDDWEKEAARQQRESLNVSRSRH